MPLFSNKNRTPLGIYIHVPFCRSKCQYCDFYSLTTKEDKWLDGYQDAVCAHIKETGPLAPDYVVDTIYFGGGTPAFLARTAWRPFSIPFGNPLRFLPQRKSPSRQTPILSLINFSVGFIARALTG